MSNTKFFAFASQGTFASPGDQVASPWSSHDSEIRIVGMDNQHIKGCIFGEASWIVRPFNRNGMLKHHSDKLIIFIGSDPNAPDNLSTEIEFWIENDKLVLTRTCVVFVPAGAAYGRIAVKNLKKPVFQYVCHINTDTYEEIPAEATAATGTYAHNWIEKYAPVDGRMPTAHEGFLTPLLWIYGKTPYSEAVWFNAVNNEGPETHAHDFDEFLGFFGTDIDHPEQLGAEITFSIGDEIITINRSCLIYIPRGLSHCPFFVPKLERPIIHFSGGNGGDYIRIGSDKF